MSSQEEFGLQTNVEAHCADPQVVQPIRSVSGAWRDIARDNTHYCFPVLVSRPTGREIYTPTSAFVDATGVWRVYRSEGGNAPLPFAPSHWMPLPAPPSSEEQHSQSEPQASTGNPATDELNLTPLPPDIKEIVEALDRELGDCVPGTTEWRTRTQSIAPATLSAARSTLLGLAGERDEARREMADVLVMTGCRDRADLEDKANVGQSLLEAIDAVLACDGPFKKWQPADGPAEIVLDLLNAHDEERAARLGAEKQLAEAVGLAREAAEAYALEVGPGGPGGFVARTRTLVAKRDGEADAK